jgi:hypothetical protein
MASRNDDDDIVALEMEPIRGQSESSTATTINSRTATPIATLRYRASQLMMIVKLYTESYPRVASGVAALLTVILFFLFLLSFRQPVKRNKLYHDYSKIDLHYNFKASQIDHWCLYGGDDACQCDDFTEPLNRFEKKDWIESHNSNIDLINPDIQYDVIFYGDDVTEGWNGRWLGRTMVPPVTGKQINKLFNETFSKAGGGDFEGLALGIMGDVVRLRSSSVTVQKTK